MALLDSEPGGISLEATRMVIVSGEDDQKFLAIEPWPVFKKTYELKTASDYDAAIRELQALSNHRSEIVEVLRRLPNSWKERDPGKYGSSYTFVISRGGVTNIKPGALKAVAVRELLTEDQIFKGTKEEWREECFRAYHYYSHVHPEMPIVSFSEVAVSNCPVCGTSQPLIRHHVQTEDSPFGDSWKRELLVICCGEIQVLDTMDSDSRIYG